MDFMTVVMNAFQIEFHAMESVHHLLSGRQVLSGCVEMNADQKIRNLGNFRINGEFVRMEPAGISQSTVMEHFQELAPLDKYSADITAGYAEQISNVYQALNGESAMKTEQPMD